MKRLLIPASVFIIFALLLPNRLIAETTSINVSCTVPVIPGVNTPAPLVNETLKPRQTQSRENKQGVEKQESKDVRAVFTTISKEEIKEADSLEEEPSFTRVSTVYNR